jgi:hypothetical protein
MRTISHPAGQLVASIAQQRDISGRLAKPSFFGKLKDVFERWRSGEEEREFARFSGCRWTDSIERQMNDAVSTAGRRPDCFDR